MRWWWWWWWWAMTTQFEHVCGIRMTRRIHLEKTPAGMATRCKCSQHDGPIWIRYLCISLSHTPQNRLQPHLDFFQTYTLSELSPRDCVTPWVDTIDSIPCALVDCCVPDKGFRVCLISGRLISWEPMNYLWRIIVTDLLSKSLCRNGVIPEITGDDWRAYLSLSLIQIALVSNSNSTPRLLWSNCNI